MVRRSGSTWMEGLLALRRVVDTNVILYVGLGSARVTVEERPLAVVRIPVWCSVCALSVVSYGSFTCCWMRTLPSAFYLLVLPARFLFVFARRYLLRV